MWGSIVLFRSLPQGGTQSAYPLPGTPSPFASPTGIMLTPVQTIQPQLSTSRPPALLTPNRVIPRTPLPSITPLPITQTFDLAPAVAEVDKYKVYVKRANGIYHLYLMQYEKDREQIPMNPGDEIIISIPPISDGAICASSHLSTFNVNSHTATLPYPCNT
jgi:hypothetical protein